jgi:cell wall-associated NlpC family hydrolase
VPREAHAAVADYRAARDQFGAVAAAEYEGGAYSSTGALLTSNSGANYLDKLNALDLLTRQQSALTARLQQARRISDSASNKAHDLLVAALARRHAVAIHRHAVVRETARYKTLLATLTAAQRRAYAARQAATPSQAATVAPAPAGNASAQRAVNFALAQVGKPYVFGAAGPSSYDCSGLTLAAWAQAGVSLPHLASAQYNYGTHVPADELQPGDLVFLYQPIGHVSMYIGHGMLVSAPQPGENVQIVPFAYFKSDFVGATRLA